MEYLIRIELLTSVLKFKHNLNISFSFLQGVKRHYPKAWSVIDAFTDSFVALLKAQYEKGIAEGVFNPMSVELLGHIDKFFIIQVVTSPAIFSDDQYTMSKLIRDYLSLRLTFTLIFTF